MKKILTMLLILVIVLTSSMAFAASGRDEVNIIADTLFLRPLGFAALVGGAAIFVIGLPMAAITGSVDKTAAALVKEPFRYTFVRPVGETGRGW